MIERSPDRRAALCTDRSPFTTWRARSIDERSTVSSTRARLSSRLDARQTRQLQHAQDHDDRADDRRDAEDLLALDAEIA